MEMPPRGRDTSETTDGCLSGNALVEDDRFVMIAIHSHAGLVTICKDIAAERIFLLWAELMGR